MDDLGRETFLQTTLEGGSARVALFVGAGISLDSGLPNFFAFGKHVCEYVTGKFEYSDGLQRVGVLIENEINSIVADLRPEVLLQTLHDELGDNIFDFYEWLDGASPNPNHFYLARAIMQGHIVLTTNIDNLIETAYTNLTGTALTPVVSPEEFEQLAADSNWLSEEPSTAAGRGVGRLLKLHGSIDSKAAETDRYSSIRFLLNQVGNGLTPGMKNVLQKCLVKLDIAFLGYSGCDHFSIHPILRETKTNRKAYWFWFDDKMQSLLSSKKTFSDIRDAIGKIVTIEGKSFADIRRGMEEYSTCDILAAREDSCRVSGHTSEVVAKVLNMPRLFAQRKPGPIPAWTETLTPYEWHICAGALYGVAHNVPQSQRFCSIAYSLATSDVQRARVHLCMGRNYMLDNTPPSNKQAVMHLTRAIAMYDACEGTDITKYPFPVLNARLILVETYTRMHDYPAALSVLDPTQEFVVQYMQREGHALSLADALNMREVRARIHRFYGLCIGLSGDPSHAQSRMAEMGTTDVFSTALAHMHKSLDFISSTGFVAGRAAALNYLGLLYSGAAEEHNSLRLLQQAETYLRQAFEINVWTGNARGCFQHLRNLGLVHIKLANFAGTDSSEEASISGNTPSPIPASPEVDTAATVEAKSSAAPTEGEPPSSSAPMPASLPATIAAPKPRRGRSPKVRYLNEALKDFRSASSFLERMPSGCALGEVMEAKFRTGEVLLRLGQKSEADGVLDGVLIMRKDQGDWHNQARTLELLLQTSDDEKVLRERADVIRKIYTMVLSSTECLGAFTKYPIQYKNAVSIVERALQTMSGLLMQGYDVSEDLMHDLTTIQAQLNALRL